MAYSESTWSSVGNRRRGHRDTVVTAVWPQMQADAWFLLVIITGAVLIGVFARFIVVQQRLELGVPWLFPYAITVGSITIVVIAIVSFLAKNSTLTPQLLILLSFVLFVLYLTGLIQTSIMLFGNGNVSKNCQASVRDNGVRGPSAATLAWLQQDSICSSWYAAFAFWIIGILAFVFLWLLSMQVARVGAQRR